MSFLQSLSQCVYFAPICTIVPFLISQPMTSLYLSHEPPTETTFSTKRIYTDYPTIRSDESHFDFSDVTLSQTLALIKYIGLCGYTEFDMVHVVIARLRNAMAVLLKRCVRANREEYSEFIYALQKNSDMVMEKLVVRCINECCQRVELSTCHLVIKEVYSLVALIYSLTNPINLPRILTEDYGLPAQHGLSVSSIQTNYLLEALHDFRNALNVYYGTLEGDRDDDTSVNLTPLKLYTSMMLYTLEKTSQTITTLTSNAVPTNVLFLYFKTLLQGHNVLITDIEHFENFICHFRDVDQLALKLKHTPLYDFQKSLIKPTFLLIISEFPLHPLTWCTPAQSINYIQMFVDVFNGIYDENLYIEQIWDNSSKRETTVIRKKGRNDRMDTGPYMLPIGNLEPLPVPDFVKVFDGLDMSTAESPENLVFSPRIGSSDDPLVSDSPGDSPELKIGSSHMHQDYPILKSSENHRDCQVSESITNRQPYQRQNIQDIQNSHFYSRSHVPTDKEYLQVYQLNELVAVDVKDARAELEKKLRNRVFLRDSSCFKCKYVPWHKHKF